MSNQLQSKVTAHVRARRNRCTAFECNAQHATVRVSGPTVAPQRVCHYGTRDQTCLGTSGPRPPILGRGNSRATRHSLFF